MMSSTKPENETGEYSPQLNYLVEKYSCDYYPTPLQSLEDYKKRLSYKLKKTFIDDFHTLRDGYTFIGKYNELLKEHLKISPDIQKTLKNVAQVQASINEGKTFQNILGWSNEDVQEIYALAENVYSKKDYYESACIFQLLCIIQPKYVEFWLGGGNAFSAENKNEDALVSYFGGLNINPYAFDLYVGICQVLCKLSQFNEALQIIEGAQQVIVTLSDKEASDELPVLKEKLLSMHDIISSHQERSIR